jgi:formylglycine-generating enzyme required for sulfatase activity/dienelactone hydrolase
MDKGVILESWKEIAAHLNRNVRTCQLWERDHGLPVHRLDGSPKARVFAYPLELDRWLHEKLREHDREARPNGKRGRATLPTLPAWNIGLIAGLAFLATAAVATSAWLLDRQAKVRWANDVAIPEIERLLLISENKQVFDLAARAEMVIPNSAQLAELMPLVRGTLSIETDPPGAGVSVRDYGKADAPWESLGLSPVAAKPLALCYRHLKIERDGFETAQGALMIAAGSAKKLTLKLLPKGSIPDGMVHIAEGKFAPVYFNLTHQAAVTLPGYALDRFEVTNRRFKAFLDAGGYARAEYWRHPFVQNGRTVPWPEAMKAFTDRTGRPGPATWSLGNYLAGEDEYPVSGVSWYEAAAFAEFEGKSLPTVHHWVRAAGDYMADSGHIVPASNFGGRGPAPVGSSPSLSPFGTNDMAGNVKEWCFNETEGKRFILGGAWDEPEYMFGNFDARDPFSREADYGFRCIKPDPGTELTAELLTPLETLRIPDFSQYPPCSDELYKVYAGLYSYTRADLRADVESRQDFSERTVVEKVAFDDATGESRMIAYVFLPRGGRPPFQTVIYFPGDGAKAMRSVFDYSVIKNREVDLFTSGGRAFVFPVIYGTFERRIDPSLPWNRERAREARIRQMRDVMRTVDYLETRSDIDHDRLAYLGLSWGGYLGSQVLALEKRLKAAVFLSGGLDVEDYQPERYTPDLDVINFIPRVTAPVLILHGRYDYIAPLRTEPTFMLELMGTPTQDKALLVKEAGHSVWQLNETRKDTFDWYDKYLGKPNR